MSRYTIACRNCDGSGNYPFYVDDDGQGHLDRCQSCYRGRITLVLTPEDERKLFNELKRSLNA